MHYAQYKLYITLALLVNHRNLTALSSTIVYRDWLWRHGNRYLLRRHGNYYDVTEIKIVPPFAGYFVFVKYFTHFWIQNEILSNHLLWVVGGRRNFWRRTRISCFWGPKPARYATFAVPAQNALIRALRALTDWGRSLRLSPQSVHPLKCKFPI